MQPSPKFRHIRLLIEKKEFAEASTELLILMRDLRASGIEVDDLIARRKALANQPEGEKIGEKLLDLLGQLLNRVKQQGEEEVASEPDRPKGESILSRILEKLGLGNRKSRSSSEPSLSQKEEKQKVDEGEKKSNSIEDSYIEKPKVIQLPQEPESEFELEDSVNPLPVPVEAAPEDQADHTQPAAVREEEDIVNISLYSPEKVSLNTKFILTAFAHLYEQKEEVAARIQDADPQASLQGAKTLNLPLKRKSSLEFRLSIENWEIEDSVQVLTWFGIPSSVEFEVQVPANYEGDQAIGSLLIKGGQGTLGRVRFNFTIVSKPSSRTSDSSFAPTESHNIQQAFLAYAPANKSLLESHIQEMKTQGMALIDPWEMAGEDWEIKVSDGLVEAELYCLFWSRDALNSTEVEISWQMALGHRLSNPQRLPDLLPVLLEEPVPDVPDELAFLNFLPQVNNYQASEKPRTLNAAADLKYKAERLLMEGKEEVFELLYDWFQKDESILEEILMQHTRWNTLKKKRRIRLVSTEESKLEENKIIYAVLSIIGQVK